MIQLNRISGIDLTAFYKKTSEKQGSCLRGSRWWKEDLVFEMKEHAKKIGLTFGISDPHWKELNDSGCCCGILPNDPIFGNWQRESATNRLIEAKANFEKTGEGKLYFKDINPFWAKEVSLVGMVCITKAPGAFARKHAT